MKKYIASVSCGKDSVAMLLLMLEREPEKLGRVFFVDTGWEFEAVLGVSQHVNTMLHQRDIPFDVLHPARSFDYMAMQIVTKNNIRGWGWCGNHVRYGTGEKMKAIKKYMSDKQHLNMCVGIAADEVKRIKDTGVRYPLVEWGITEKRALEICREHGVTWKQEGVDLYDIFDRVSCWCCANHNIKELRNMREHLPATWERLREMQRKIPYRYKSETVGVEELEARFAAEEMQEQLKI